MTQPPYGTPSGYPPGYPPPPPPKKRPGWGWFVLGGGLIVAAAVVGVVLFIWVLASFFETDARVPADDRPYAVTVGTDGDRMLWLELGMNQSCEVVDTQTSEPLAQEPASGTLERSDRDGSWVGDTRFAPGSGRLEITCTGGGTVLVGPAPEIGSFIAGILLTILLPLGLGLVGLVILIVTGVLWAVRPKS
ncbi:hypothetical protein [Nocardioides sp. SR21]|uniref:hypothetical protein n=1 Tax=Nocardioides sp. SR21 TaxID=2919501 RepID=UPI001FA95513|nr:hypothetical protein [Nocardioides sp. SR21]